MSKISAFNTIWDTVSEIDLRPIRAEAEQPLSIAILADDGDLGALLETELRADPENPARPLGTAPLLLLTPENLPAQSPASLVIVLFQSPESPSAEVRARVRAWVAAGQRVLAIQQIAAPLASPRESLAAGIWESARLLAGDVANPAFVQSAIIPAILRLLPEKHLALARQWHAFRPAVARKLIQETSVNNAIYALSTGLAEQVPILNIPLNVADVVVLTKAQAFLVYRLGMALGMSTEWRTYIAEFGGVLGGGFVWRQVARSLVGLIPVWGLAPKVAVAYAGTYVVGQTVWQWYQKGRHIEAKQMKQLYAQAWQNGKQLALNLKERMPRLPRRVKALPVAAENLCPLCSKPAPADAQFCPYCGQRLGEIPL
ncbi:MAG: hypothetical protein OHK0052_24270 [Anaerolineales bacterium]